MSSAFLCGLRGFRLHPAVMSPRPVIMSAQREYRLCNARMQVV
jgi:hypothetical protein